MNTRDNSISDNNFRKLLNNDNYYRHIFKKTEKIVSVVFYILNNVEIEKKSETLVSNIASKAHFAHENALRTLEVKLVSSKEVLEQFAQSLVGLDSTLRIAAATGFIGQDVLSTITNEIDAVLRGLRSYIQSNSPIEELSFAPSYGSVGVEQHVQSTPRPVRKVAAPKAEVTTSVSTGNDRRERIKTILEAKKEATIKDISEIITDVSEKTIQRELNALIEENIVKREGERRWSRYSLY